MEILQILGRRGSSRIPFSKESSWSLKRRVILSNNCRYFAVVKTWSQCKVHEQFFIDAVGIIFNPCYLLSFLGFVFSESEGSALEQFEGGPCAVIAPVQVT